MRMSLILPFSFCGLMEKMFMVACMLLLIKKEKRLHIYSYAGLQKSVSFSLLLPTVRSELQELQMERDRLLAELEEAKREIARLKGEGRSRSTNTMKFEGQTSSIDFLTKS